MAHQQSPPRDHYTQPYERAPVSPLITSQQYSHSLSGIPSLQSLRSPYRSQDAHDLNHHLVSPIMSRTPSIASDRYSTVSGLTANHFSTHPQNVNPAPAYVAPSGASQVVGEHRGSSRPPSSDGEEKASQGDVQFSELGLTLINSFLDQLLFSFLSTARSTTLFALKNAVTEVLKSRLARDAITSAEEELHELLAGSDEEEELNTKQNAAENNRQWDLELVWKRTRLRVMVYMRLGEMEDDDEERYVKEEELFQGNEKRFSQTSGLVSWAAAIFLTGVLEYVAEQTLQAAGSAAFSRARRQHRLSRAISPEEAESAIVVEEHDVEKVALSPTLGRLWRTWRKLQRSNALVSGQRSGPGRLSHETLGGQSTASTVAEGSVHDERANSMRLEDVPEMEYPEHVLASNIPLPIGDRGRDVDEIEVPGLARDPDVHDVEDGDKTPTARRNSFTGLASYRTTGGLPTPDGSSPVEQIPETQRPQLTRRRSSSVPTPARTPLEAEKIFHIPGALPEEPETPGAGQAAHDANTDADLADDAEPKANAAEMASHKRFSHDVKPLLDAVAAHEPPEESAEQEKRDESHGLLEGVVAGVSATATAAAAALARRGKAGKEHAVAGESGDRDVIADSDNTGNAPVGEEPAQSAASGAPTDSGLADDQWDTHKSLVDMKALLGSGAVKGRGREEDKGALKAVRTSSEESRKSYTLGHRELQKVPQQFPAQRQHLSPKPSLQETAAGSGMGVASTSGTRLSKTPSPDVDGQQARDRSMRPARLHLPGTTTRKAIESPDHRKSESPKTPREFLESRSLAARNDRSEERRVMNQPTAVDPSQPPAVRQLNKRRSIPGVAFTSAAATPLMERNPHRQSWSAAVQQQREYRDGNTRPVSVAAVPSVPIPHRNTISESPVQEHPLVQRMASLKRKERKSDPPAGEEAAALTSASIRGPEDFDMFVQGAETVKYTLTPGNVRDTPAQPYEKPKSPVELSSAPSVSRRRVSAPAPADAPDARTGRSVVSKQVTSAGAPKADAQRISREEKRRSISKPPPRNTSAHRRSGLMAREPRVLTQSTRDFADFIRSTGPSKDQDVKPILNPANMSTTSLHSLRSAHINGASRSSSVVSQDRTRSMTKAAMEHENVPPLPPMPVPGKKTSMQPRHQNSGADGNSELIDFIRTGPNQDGEHRISRSVAPFRSTMDSDQLQPMGEQLNGSRPQGLKLDTNVGATDGPPSAKSQRSAKESAHRAAARSRASGANGNTAHNVHPAHSGEPQRLSAATTPTAKAPAAEGALPGRRRYRNKDPYAIDLDDDDDDLLTALPKNRREEESLADFLNNTEPPKDNGPRPLVGGSGAQARTVLNRSRVNSVNSMRSAANGDAAGRNKSMQTPTGPRPGSMSSTRSQQPVGATLTHRTSASMMDGSAQRPKMEARSPGEANKDHRARIGTFTKESNTRDLADFLKNSGPEDPQSAPAPSVGWQSKLTPKEAAKAQKKVEKDSKGGKRSFFGKALKKRTWLDMP